MASSADSAAAAAISATEGPVMNLMNKRLRNLRKKYNRIVQMEETASQGKPLNKEQEEVLRSKPAVAALIDEYERLRSPLSSALQEELSLHTASTAEDLLKLLYFGSLFDVKPQSEFTSTMLTRTHERGCCLTYDYVTEDATDLLGERDLDALSLLGGLLTSRPPLAGISHRNALVSCIHHAKRWLDRSNEPFQPDSDVTYADLRERLNKIMASDYFTTTSELKVPVIWRRLLSSLRWLRRCLQWNPQSLYRLYKLKMPQLMNNTRDLDSLSTLHSPDIHIIANVELVLIGTSTNGGHWKEIQDEEDLVNFSQNEVSVEQTSLVNEAPKTDGVETMDSAGDATPEEEQNKVPTDEEHQRVDREFRDQQNVNRRPYPNQRGGSRGGGGRRGYYGNGRVGRGGRGGGSYQNGRDQNYESGYQQKSYYNPKGRGGRGGQGGSAAYTNHGLTTYAPHVPVNAETG
ncbi:hypothetical protein QJS10_CPB18g01216 [Acorus calamus]|uniref:Glycine-rich protein n=1 Tax=Acorus calamus TaxID=4465 RepID=A0AAV9CL28_ACOCL|nr:hypothetical protein QJS10_CPB18g01216 [Acorus calamus]